MGLSQVMDSLGLSANAGNSVVLSANTGASSQTSFQLDAYSPDADDDHSIPAESQKETGEPSVSETDSDNQDSANAETDDTLSGSSDASAQADWRSAGAFFGVSATAVSGCVPSIDSLALLNLTSCSTAGSDALDDASELLSELSALLASLATDTAGVSSSTALSSVLSTLQQDASTLLADLLQAGTATSACTVSTEATVDVSALSSASSAASDLIQDLLYLNWLTMALPTTANTPSPLVSSATVGSTADVSCATDSESVLLSNLLDQVMDNRVASASSSAASSTESSRSALSEQIDLSSLSSLSSSLLNSMTRNLQDSSTLSINSWLQTDSAAHRDASSSSSSSGLIDSQGSVLNGITTSSGSTDSASLQLDTSQDNWNQQLISALGDRVQTMTSESQKTATVRLDPPELGRLEISVRQDGDRLSVQIHTSNQNLRDALMESREQLKQVLIPEYGAGVEVDISYSQDSGNAANAWANNEEQVSGNASSTSDTSATGTTSTSVPQGLLDTLV